MKPTDVQNHLRRYLPKFTSLFTDTVPATVVVDSGVATATYTTGVRDTKIDEMIVIWDSSSLNAIVSVVKSGTEFTFTTTDVHDLTLGVSRTATLEGFTESVWNDEFELLSVPSPTSFVIRSVNPNVPSPIDGSLVGPGEINGAHGVSAIVGPSAITFNVPGVADQTLDVTLEFAPRIMVVPTVERMDEMYTEHAAGDFWMFVIPGDANASKDRNVLSDGITTRLGGDDPRTRFIEPYSLLVRATVGEQLAAEQVMDICRQELLRPILQSVLGFKFDQGVCDNQSFRFMMTGHHMAEYSGQTYTHEYTFESAFDVTEGDLFVPEHGAFRDLTLNFNYTPAITMTAHTELPSDD